VNATPEPAASRRKQHAARPKERAPRRAKRHAAGKDHSPRRRRRFRERAGIVLLVLVSIALFTVVVISFIRLQRRLDTARSDACSMATNVAASPTASRFIVDDARRDVARYCPH